MKIEITLLLVSFFVTVILGMIIIPILRKFKVGQIEREDGPKSHLKKQGTPTMGGIIIIFSMLIATIATAVYLQATGDGELAQNLIPILLLTMGFGLIGFIDDFKKLVLKNTEGLKPSYKMLGLLVISVAFVIYLIQGTDLGTETYIPILKQYITLPMYIYVPAAICVILATTNAVNLTDGIDGLSSSISTIIITCLTVIGMLHGVTEVYIFGSIVIGAVLGFIWMLQNNLEELLSSAKVVFSVLTWFLYAALIIFRRIKPLTQRQTAQWTIIGFVLIIITYFGVASFMLR